MMQSVARPGTDGPTIWKRVSTTREGNKIITTDINNNNLNSTVVTVVFSVRSRRRAFLAGAGAILSERLQPATATLPKF